MPAQTVIQIRRDTAANWESTDPTLASGEIGFDTTNNQIKIGNGSDEWTVLDYASGGASVQISETAPVDPDEGNVWFNSTDGRAYIYYDSTWVDLNPGIAGPAGKFTVSETEPADPAIGDGWFNSGTARLFIYYDNFWVEATSNYIGPTGEPGIAVQTSPPTDTDVLWLDSDDPADAVAVPAGGSTGQVLAKASATDYDSAWTTLREPPSGNAIINGGFDIWQRGTTFTGVGGYTADRWNTYSPATARFTPTRSTDVPTPSGLTYSWVATSTGAYTPTSGEYIMNTTRIEGFNAAQFNFGTASARSLTLSFWVKSSLTGTFGGACHNNAFDRTYVFNYTISAANTWEYKTVTIAGDTSGTWDKTTAVGFELGFSLGAHTASLTTAGSWVSGAFWGVTGQVNLVGTSGATWQVTGVQLEAGSEATPFRRNGANIGEELTSCQRYFQTLAMVSATAVTSSTVAAHFTYLTQMRDSPTIGQEGLLNFQGAGNNQTQSALGIGSVAADRMGATLFAVPNFSGLTTFRPEILAQSGNNGNKITLSAEL